MGQSLLKIFTLAAPVSGAFTANMAVATTNEATKTEPLLFFIFY